MDVHRLGPRVTRTPCVGPCLGVAQLYTVDAALDLDRFSDATSPDGLLQCVWNDPSERSAYRRDRTVRTRSRTNRAARQGWRRTVRAASRRGARGDLAFSGGSRCRAALAVASRFGLILSAQPSLVNTLLTRSSAPQTYPVCRGAGDSRAGL